VTKLQVSKSKRTLTLVENRPIQLNCSVKSQTSQNSHFAVLWYVHKPSDADGKLILKTTHNSAFEYGTYAEEEGLRARLQFERHVSGGLFSLTVQRAEVSDSGSYYCHVEEWLLSPNYAWYKLAEEVSGRTEVTVKQPGKASVWPSCSVACLQTLGPGRALLGICDELSIRCTLDVGATT
jgi:immunoglobulin superfamily protein 2/3